jgi:hypothetical protein
MYYFRKKFLNLCKNLSKIQVKMNTLKRMLTRKQQKKIEKPKNIKTTKVSKTTKNTKNTTVSNTMNRYNTITQEQLKIYMNLDIHEMEQEVMNSINEEYNEILYCKDLVSLIERY